MSFQQLSFALDSLVAEQLSDILFDCGALSVTIEDQHAGTSLEQPIFDEPGMETEQLWKSSRLIALFDKSIDLKQIVSSAQDNLGIQLNYTQEVIDDQDWVSLSQDQFKPIKVNERLYIVPSWHASPDLAATNIILDPGLAFGTGSHPTTFMCLQWLAEHLKPHHTVLDYGCGSGILAISAKMLGSQHVDGVDIDPQAIEASLANCQTNAVTLDFYLPHEFKPRQYDLVIANILSNPLRILASLLSSYVKAGGDIILSGILDTQTDEISQIYAPWFNMEVYRTQEGWVCLHGVRLHEVRLCGAPEEA